MIYPTYFSLTPSPPFSPSHAQADKLQRAQEYAERVKAVNKQKAEIAQFKKQFEGPTVGSKLPKGGYVAADGDPRHGHGRGPLSSGNSGSSGGSGPPKPRLIAANGLTDDQKQEQARKRAQVSAISCGCTTFHLRSS